MIALVVYSTALWSQNWVGFSRSEPTAPEINLITSNAQTVTFEVNVPGIYTKDTVVNGIAFTRLTLPNGGAINSAGSPEIPVLTYNVAIPDCESIEVEYSINSKQNMAPCWVYPKPVMVLEQNTDGAEMYVEQFAFNPIAYTQPYSPEPVAIISSSGALRAQRYVEVMINAVEFCPVTKQLSVKDKIEVTLTFTNPKGDIRQNVGIFNKVAANAFINYEDDGISASVNDKAFEKPGFTRGNVQWFTLSDTAQAATIPGDYLIITVPEFFDENNPNSQLKRLAEHRAFYNGFDVSIVNVDNILSLPFFYEGNPANPYEPDAYKKEQRMRTFIRRVFEGKNAQHTQDGKLGYVLLVGDNHGANEGMPTAWEHCAVYQTCTEPYPSDHYFCCVTKNTSGFYDRFGDLFIGRFSVESPAHLFNMVEKTINFETEYSPKSWRHSAGFTIGGLFNANYFVSYNNFVSNLVNQKGWNCTIVDWYQNSNTLDPTLNYLNDGVTFVQYIGHGSTESWASNLYINALDQFLNNNYKTPFINALTCSSGGFDNKQCLAEYITREWPNMGSVGYIGATRIAAFLAAPFTDVNNLPYQGYYPYFLFAKNISIAGELMLTSKSASEGFTPPQDYLFTLFGDPALNIFAEGYEITRDETVYSTDQANIKCPIRLHNNATFTLSSNSILSFQTNGKLIIESNGNVKIKGDVLIKGSNQVNTDTETSIHCKGGGFYIDTIGNGFFDNPSIKFQNLPGGIILENAQSELSPFAYGYKLRNVIFDNTPLLHRGTRLNISNCSFRASDVKTSVSIFDIDSCTFKSSTFLSDNSEFPKIIIHDYINIVNCQFSGNNNNLAIQLIGLYKFHLGRNKISGYKAGISLTISGSTLSLINVVNDRSPSGLICYNDISNCGIGIGLYNSSAVIAGNNIYNNDFGVNLYNNSYTFFDSGIIEPQIIRDCSSIELYASRNAFPTIFHYNKIIDEDNLGNDYNDPLLWWDYENIFSSETPLIDISCNYWGENFIPAEDIHPYDQFIVDPVWEPGKSGSPTPEPAEILYQSGLDDFSNEDYSNAETTFKNLIETYPKSSFAIAALHELFALEQFTDNDYYKLYGYYASIAPTDTALFAVADFLATRCHVKEKNWQPAVDWYEDRIENPPSYQDSVFAVIDLGDIHLMMAADTAGAPGAKCALVSYRLADIKPHSKQLGVSGGQCRGNTMN